jgi:uncharacterized iron-regulated membrane protein
MQKLRRFLILFHRYLGIPLSFVFALWFVSGIAMIYVGGMPELTPAGRLEHLPPLDLSAVQLAPAAAARRAELGVEPDRVTLSTVLERPAYRFGAGPFGSVTVFADDGALLEPIDGAAARGAAARFLGVPEDSLRFAATITEPDQWTLLLSRSLPLHKIVAADAAGSVAYVSPETAEVVLVTTRRSRAFAWIATIPHWLYFTPLRADQPLWYWTVVGLSGVGCVLAVLGLALGVVQFRKTTPFRLSSAIRYTGWMRWHYVLGTIFGVFALTWVFSGLLSMEPFAWTNAEGLRVRPDAFSGGALDLAAYGAPRVADWLRVGDGAAPKEIELERIEDEPYFLARYAPGPSTDAAPERLHQPYAVAAGDTPARLLVHATTLSARTDAFSTESLLARLRAALPDERIVEHELLTDYDSYYYSRDGQAPLPVLRVKFADPMRTWVYVDPALARTVAVIHRLNRLERWLYNGLHSLDFRFWYGRRPLWDIGVLALLLGALGTTLIGLVFGLKRARSDIARLLARR